MQKRRRKTQTEKKKRETAKEEKRNTNEKKKRKKKKRDRKREEQKYERKERETAYHEVLHLIDDVLLLPLKGVLLHHLLHLGQVQLVRQVQNFLLKPHNITFLFVKSLAAKPSTQHHIPMQKIFDILTGV